MSETGATDTTAAFIARWGPSGGKELANYQFFLIELCTLPGSCRRSRPLRTTAITPMSPSAPSPFSTAPLSKGHTAQIQAVRLALCRLPGARQCLRDGDPFYQGAHRQGDGAHREPGEAGLGQEGGGEASRMTPILHEPAKRFLLTGGRVCYFPLTRRSSSERR